MTGNLASKPCAFWIVRLNKYTVSYIETQTKRSSTKEKKSDDLFVCDRNLVPGDRALLDIILGVIL
jgi:hypothetical protein